MTGRRAFLQGIGLAALAVPVGAAAQSAGRTYRIGFLGGASLSGYAHLVDAFVQGLGDRGYVVDKNVTIAAGVQVGVDPEADRARFPLSPGGVVVIGKGQTVPAPSPRSAPGAVRASGASSGLL